MTSNTLSPRLPWQDRWTQPTVKQLLDPLNAQHRRVFEQLMEDIQKLDKVEFSPRWYGPSWHWTLDYRITPVGSKEPVTLCFLVPKVGSPITCVPLTDEQIEALPIRRLNKVVRDGIKSAKCAVSLHWATWTPNNLTETGHLIDLIKRKHKMLTEPGK